jgi:hypothetical protein
VLILRGLWHGLGAVGAFLDPSAVQTISATIQRVEGYYPGTLAYTNNNPGNLRYVGQLGATAGAGGFARFPSYDAGMEALGNQLQIYAGRGMTIQEMMSIYAPASDGNDPGSYARRIADTLGVTPDTRLVDLSGGAAAPLDSSPVDVVGLSPEALASALSGIDPVMAGLAAGVAGLIAWGLFS